MDGNSNTETAETPIAPVKKRGFKFSRFFPNQKEPEIGPKISVDIFFSQHRTSDDFKGLKEKVGKADIFFPEFVGWGQKDVVLFNEVARGEVSPEEAVGEGPGRDAFLGMLGSIYKSNKPIAFVDLSADDPSHKKSGEELKPLRYIFQDFEANLNNMRSIVKNHSEVELKREQHIASTIKPKVQEVLINHPELKVKGELKVLLSLGSGHAVSLYGILQAKGLELINKPEESVVEVTFFDEGRATYISQQPLSRELLAKIFLENLFVNTDVIDKSKIADTKKIYFLTRKLFSESSMEYTKEVFERFKKKEGLRSILEEKFGPLPKTEQELDEFLARPSLAAA